jgi:hypothetical protein
MEFLLGQPNQTVFDDLNCFFLWTQFSQLETVSSGLERTKERCLLGLLDAETIHHDRVTPVVSA